MDLVLTRRNGCCFLIEMNVFDCQLNINFSERIREILDTDQHFILVCYNFNAEINDTNILGIGAYSDFMN